jgi:DNA-binding GntR family transcriptional regulator
MSPRTPTDESLAPEPLRHHTLNHRVYEAVRELILSGRIPLGAQLDEVSLASRLGVSRTPLREAIAKLAKERLVEHRPYRGNFVWMPTAQEAHDLFEVRKALEVLAVQTAVPRLSDEQIDELRAILADVDAALARHDMVGYGVADRRFHAAIAAYSRNQVLLEALDSLGSRIHLIRMLVNQDPRAAELAAAERPLILRALAGRDGALAGQLMHEHIEHVQRHAVGELIEQERGRSIDGGATHGSDLAAGT